MDGWMDGLMDGWTDRQTEKQTQTDLSQIKRKKSKKYEGNKRVIVSNVGMEK